MAPHAELDDDAEDFRERNHVEDRIQSDGSETSEDEDEDEDDEEEYIDVKKKFDKILQHLKSNHWNLSNPSQRDAFINRNEEVLKARTVDEQQNLLHILANIDKESLPSWEQQEHLVRILVRLPGNLLAERDGDNKTPLYIAASKAKRKYKLLRAMAEAHDNIDSVLGIRCFNMETCLHVAIRKMVPQTHVLYLISLAGPETLCVQDNQGNTPLHVAVDYALCVDDHLKIVQALIAKSDAAMDLVNKKGMSPYRYHEETCVDALNKAKKAQDAEARRDARENDQRSNQGRSDRPAAEPPYRPQKSTPSQDLPKPLQNPTTDAAPGKYGAGPTRGMAVSSVPQLGVPVINTDLAQENGSNRSGTQTPTIVAETKKSKSLLKKSLKVKREEVKPSTESANAVKSFLKLHYLRTRKHDDAVEFLYGSSQGILISLSYIIKKSE